MLNVFQKNSCRTGNNGQISKNTSDIVYSTNMISATASATCRSIYQEYAEDVMDNETAYITWNRNETAYIGKSQDGDGSCKDHSRSERLGTATTHSSHPTVANLVLTLSEQRTTVERWMHALGFITKLDQCTPHPLTVRQRKERISTLGRQLHFWPLKVKNLKFSGWRTFHS